MASETGNDGRKSTAIATGTAALLEQLQSQLPAPWLKAVSDQLNQFQDTVLGYENQLHYAELKIQVLEERLRLLYCVEVAVSRPILSKVNWYVPVGSVTCVRRESLSYVQFTVEVGDTYPFARGSLLQAIGALSRKCRPSAEGRHGMILPMAQCNSGGLARFARSSACCGNHAPAAGSTSPHSGSNAA